jgi:hypothetical protein
MLIEVIARGSEAQVRQWLDINHQSPAARSLRRGGVYCLRRQLCTLVRSVLTLKHFLGRSNKLPTE